MLRWGLVAVTAVLLVITVLMFVDRFSDDPPTASPMIAASQDAPATATDTPASGNAEPETAAPAVTREQSAPATAPLPTAPAPTEPYSPPESSTLTVAQFVERPAAPMPVVLGQPPESQPKLELARQTAQSAPFSLTSPVACDLGRNCFIQQYMDVDPGPAAQDFMCGHLSYQGHSGTDFRPPNLKAMRDGVPVIAARGGVVRALRDGMADVNVKTLPEGAVDGRECGNAVVLTHEDGWETQYCHLQKGSVSVRKGQIVQAGDQLGLIGMSGKAQFPHVHLSVRKDGQKVDPFRGLDPQVACGGDYRPLWDAASGQQVAYQPGGILDLGMVDRQLTPDQAASGEFSPSQLDRNGQALVAWYYVFGIRQGDVMSISITGPDGNRVFSQTLNPHPKDQAQYFAFGGRRTPPDGFQPGTYRAEVQMIRNGALHDRRGVSVTLH
ncbi:MAG: peptidoglycan DD-metalloendopeptidase family protein [Minwuia sp.]|nr:peptidoglycan DD-metalloendopeptidase family protein [Minwuia sp.]